MTSASPTPSSASRGRSTGLALSVLAGLVLAYGLLRFLRSAFIPATHGLTGDFAAVFPAPYFARLRPDFPVNQVWEGGWYAGPMLHFLTLPLFALPRWWMVPPAWALANLTALIVSFVCVCRLTEVSLGGPWRRLAVLASLWMLFQPLGTAFASGNIELMEMALTLSAIVALRNRHEGRAGTLIGAATMLKFLPIGFLGWFVMRQRWRALVTATVSIAIIATITAMTLGWQQSAVASALSAPSSWSNAGFHELSITSMFLHLSSMLDTHVPLVRWFPSVRAEVAGRAGGLASVLLAVGMFVVLFLRRRLRVSALEVAVLFMTMFLIVPRNHDYYYVFALVPMSVLFLRAVAAREWGVLALVLVAYALISPPVPFAWMDRTGWFSVSFAYVMNYQNVPVIGGLVLWFTATNELLREPSDAGAWPSWLSARVVTMTLAVVGVAAIATMVATRPSSGPKTDVSVSLQPALASFGGAGLAVSPDGARIAYIAEDGVLCSRAIDQGTPVCWPEIHEVASPFFSPDGRSIGFFATSVLMQVPATGGAAHGFTETPDGQFGSWAIDASLRKSSPRGLIIYASPYGICRLDPVVGTPEFIVPQRREDGRYLSPSMLPSGDAVLFTIAPANGGPGAGTIAVQSLRTGKRTVLMPGSQPQFDAVTRTIVYALGNRVMATPFDPETFQLTGVAEPLVGNVMVTPTYGAQFTLGADGTLLYVPATGPAPVRRTLQWVSRAGVATSLPFGARAFASPRIAPDGRHIAVAIQDVVTDAWTFDVETGRLTRVSGGHPSGGAPVWSPDGARLAFGLLRDHALPGCAACPAVVVSGADHDGQDDTLWAARDEDSAAPVRLTQWSRDGRMVLGTQLGDIWALDLSKPSSVTTTQSAATESDPTLSPDGRWLVFASSRSGRVELYAQPFPATGDARQITTVGASEPVFSRDGRELYFRTADAVMVAPVSMGGTLSLGAPQRLFTGAYLRAGSRNFDVAPDGQHFVMVSADTTPVPPRDLRVLRGWRARWSR